MDTIENSSLPVAPQSTKKYWVVIIVLLLVVGLSSILIFTQKEQPTIVNIDGDEKEPSGPKLSKAYTDAFTITEHTNYDITHNELYVDIVNNLNKNMIINVSKIFSDSELTDKIIYGNVLMNQSYPYLIYEEANVSIGKYSITNKTISNVTGENITHYYSSADVEMFCDYVLADKSCMVSRDVNLRNETRWDYMPIPAQKSKINVGGINIEFKDGGIPIAKSSVNGSVQLKYTYHHPLAIPSNEPTLLENKYDIEVCSEDGLDCSVLDPTWYEVAWTKRKQINITGVIPANYSVKLNITYDSDMMANFSDLRFTNSTNDGVLPHYIDYMTPSVEAIVWVMVQDNSSINVYYGNNAAATTSNIETAFVLGDDFNAYNTTKWYCEMGAQATYCPVENGYVYAKRNTDSKALISIYPYNFSNNYGFVAYVNSTPSGQQGFGLDSNPYNFMASAIQQSGSAGMHLYRSDAGGNQYYYANASTTALDCDGGSGVSPCELYITRYSIIRNSTDANFYINKTLMGYKKISNIGKPVAFFNGVTGYMMIDKLFVYKVLDVEPTITYGTEESGGGGGDTDYPIFTNEQKTANGTTWTSNGNYAFQIEINRTNGTAGIEFDGVNYSMTNASAIFSKTISSYKAGTFNYSYWAYGNGSSTNYNATPVYAYTISKATNTASLLLNGTAANLNITYPSKVNATGTCTTGPTLYRNGNTVVGGTFADLKSEYYNFTLTCTGGENYTTPSPISYFANISKGTGLIYTYINGARGNVSVSNGTIASVNGTLINGVGTVNLYRNGTLINTGTGSVQNSSLYSYLYNWTIKANYTGNENYTAASEEWTLGVVASGTIIVLKDSPSNFYVTNQTSVIFNWTIIPNGLNITNWTFNLWNITDDVINSSLENANYNSYRECYQESANISNIGDGDCELNYSGEYGYSGSPEDWHLIIDNNWLTQGNSNGALGYGIYINYSKPNGNIRNATLRYKYAFGGGTAINYNVSISENCLNANSDKLMIYMSTQEDTFNDKVYIKSQCLNLTYDVITLFQHEADSPNPFHTARRIYEEGIVWNITDGYNNAQTNNITINSLSNGNYSWGVSACGNNSAGEYACDTSSNRTITIDTVTPTITLIYPTNQTPLGTIGQNYTLNYTIGDLNPSICGYAYNGVISYMGCSGTSSFILASNRSITLFANDSAGNFKSQTFNNLFTIIESNNTNSETTLETKNETFILNLTYDKTLYTFSTANFIFDGTTYLGEKTSTSTGAIFTRTIDMPIVNETTNKSFYWSVYLTNNTGSSSIVNSTTFNISISQIILSACNTTVKDKVVNYTIYNETSRAIISADFDAILEYYLGSGSIKKNATADLTGASHAFCVSPNATYYTDASIHLAANSYTDRNYFFNNQNYTPSSVTNQPLYLLDSSLDTNIILEFKDVNLRSLAGYYIETWRKYDDLGKDLPIHIDKTDEFGVITTNLVENTVKYKFKFYAPNNTLVKSTSEYVVVACRYSVCVITFLNDASNTVVGFNNLSDYEYSLYYDNDTYTFIYTWNDDTGASTPQHRLLVHRTAYLQNSVVCNTTSTALSGSLSCFVGSNYSSYSAQAFRYASPEKRIGILNIQVNDITKKFGTEGLLWSFFLLMMMIVIGIWYPPVGVGLYIVGFILLKVIGVIYAPPEVLIAEIAVGVAFIWAFRG